jgi:hypothetical protein
VRLVRSVGTVIMLASLTACIDQGANAEDRERLDRLIADPITTVEIAGLVPTSEMSTQLAESSSAVLGGSDVANVVLLQYQFGNPPTDQDLRVAAQDYIDAFADAGWRSVSASCQILTEGGTYIRLSAARDNRGYLETASVAFGPNESLWTIEVFLTAPRHDNESGPIDGGSDADCFKNARVD